MRRKVSDCDKSIRKMKYSFDRIKAAKEKQLTSPGNKEVSGVSAPGGGGGGGFWEALPPEVECALF